MTPTTTLTPTTTRRRDDATADVAKQDLTPTMCAREASGRDAAIEAAYASGAYTLKAIGEHFGLHYATASRIARRRMLQNKT